MTLPTGSNYFSLFVRENLKNRPQDFTVTDAQLATIERQQAARRAVRDKDKPKEAVQVEYNRLRGQLFTLQQNAKAFEILFNNLAGTVKVLESRITTLLKSKKEHDDANNLLGARSYEHQIQGLETELMDARERLLKEQRWNSSAAREMRTWQTDNG